MMISSEDKYKITEILIIFFFVFFYINESNFIYIDISVVDFRKIIVANYYLIKLSSQGF